MASSKSISSSQSRTQSTVINNNIAKKSTPSPEKSSQNSYEDDDDDEKFDDTPIPEGLVRCHLCKRNFAEDRIEKHQVICQKIKTKKRRVYDASKKRVQVSQAEIFNFSNK